MPRRETQFRFAQKILLGFFDALLVIIVFLSQIAVASNEYLIDTWTAENGLPNSSVTAIAQTPDGYLWVGTYNGLARFDGVRFITFDPSNEPELQRARVRKLYVDDHGTLWINTDDGSLTAYHENEFKLEWKGRGAIDEQATQVSFGTNEIAFLLFSGELIRHIKNANSSNRWEVLRCPSASSGALCCQDRDGVFWYRGRNHQLWRLVGDQFELVPSDSGLKGTRINALVRDAKGRVWVGTEMEIAVWDGRRFQDMTPTNSAERVNVSFLFVAPNEDVWVVSEGVVRKAAGARWVFEERLAGPLRRVARTSWRA